MFVYLVCTVHVEHLCRHMLTIWVTKFLQCTAHGRFDSQVPPFGAYGGGPGQRKIRARKFSVYFQGESFWIIIHLSMKAYRHSVEVF